MATRCSAKTASGHPCRAWAVHDTDPPLCSAHGGGKRPVGAPQGNRNAEKHGWYSQQRPSPDASPDSNPSASSGFYSSDPTDVTIDEAIAGLVDKMTRLDEIIVTAKNGEYVIRLFELYTQASSRLSRMLRDRRALSGEAADGIAGAIAQAMDELGTELGVELT